jgi:conjugal transfer/entry exclusion protein
MKNLIALAVWSFAIALPSRAQWVVYDPSVHTQMILGTAQEIAKYVEMINNQVQQIQSLTDQLNEFKHYETLFGDPKAVALATANALTSELRRTELGKSLDTLMEAADGVAALTYNASGLYHTIGETFSTPAGATVRREPNQYKPFAAVNESTANYITVSTNSAARRVELKAQIAQTTDQLRAAQTDAEVQKLTGLLIGYSAALAGTEQEVNQALAGTLVQDIENRNDERKQQQAVRDQVSAEFTEGLDNYRTKFRLVSQPARFPTK